MQHGARSVAFVGDAMARLPNAAVGNVERVGRNGELVLENGDGLLLL